MLGKENNLSIVLSNILYFVLGVVFIVATDELIQTFNYILVCICAIIGVIQILNFIISKKYKDNDYTGLITAIVFIWVSLILYIYYGFMINILPILFSLYLFIIGCNMIIRFISLKGTGYRKKYIFLSIIAFLVGILLIFNPGSVIYTYLKITGVYLIILSVLGVLELFKK